MALHTADRSVCRCAVVREGAFHSGGVSGGSDQERATWAARGSVLDAGNVRC